MMKRLLKGKKEEGEWKKEGVQVFFFVGGFCVRRNTRFEVRWK